MAWAQQLRDMGYPVNPDVWHPAYDGLVNGTHTIPSAPSYSTPIGPGTDI